MIKKLLSDTKKLFLTAGLSSEEFKNASAQFDIHNRNTLIVFSSVGTVLFFILMAANHSKTFLSHNFAAYTFAFASNFGILILSLLNIRKRSLRITMLMYFSELIMFIFAIWMGTYLLPDRMAISFLIMLFILPAIYYQRPIVSILISITMAVFFIIVAKDVKLYFMDDLVNVLSYGFFSIVINTYLTKIKVSYIHSYMALDKTFSEKQKIYEIINTLAERYSIVFTANIETGALKTVYINDDFTKVIEATGNSINDPLSYSDWIQLISDKIIHEEDRSLFIENTLGDAFCNKIKNGKTISFEFRAGTSTIKKHLLIKIVPSLTKKKRNSSRCS